MIIVSVTGDEIFIETNCVKSIAIFAGLLESCPDAETQPIYVPFTTETCKLMRDLWHAEQIPHDWATSLDAAVAALRAADFFGDFTVAKEAIYHANQWFVRERVID